MRATGRRHQRQRAAAWRWAHLLRVRTALCTGSRPPAHSIATAFRLRPSTVRHYNFLAPPIGKNCQLVLKLKFGKLNFVGRVPVILREDEMPTRNINLTDHYDQFVAEQLNAGRYRNISEVMRAGLRLLEQQTREDEKKLEVLRALAAEGFRQIDQGDGTVIHSRRELEDMVDRIDRRAIKPIKSRSKGA